LETLDCTQDSKCVHKCKFGFSKTAPWLNKNLNYCR